MQTLVDEPRHELLGSVQRVNMRRPDASRFITVRDTCLPEGNDEGSADLALSTQTCLTNRGTNSSEAFSA